MMFGRNIRFLFEITKGLGKSEHPEVLEIGDGLLALRWSDDENFIIYFDTGRWSLLIDVAKNYKEAAFPSELRNIGVLTTYLLQQKMTVPQVVEIIAKIVLIPTASHYKWANG